MAGYRPLYIASMETGLVQERQEFILPDDAYPTLENAFVWRERIRRKQGYELLGQLQRIFTAQALGNADGGGNFSGNIRTIFSLETTGSLAVGSLSVSDGTHTFNDNGLGIFVGTPSGSGTINYNTMAITLSGATPGAALTITFNYFPGLPVMGLRQRILKGINVNQLIAFDTKYAYQFGPSGFQEFIPRVTWTGSNSQFFWSTNYYQTKAGLNVFWVTNFNDPIRFTDGSNWANFAPVIDASATTLTNCLCMLPYRGRLVVANTIEGGQQFAQRLRWAAIGTPFTIDPAVGVPGNIAVNPNVNAWRDDIRGQGGYLDVPTSDPIVSIGFVRDNMVVYCENTTWQLRYNGRSISPFQIERVNSELGVKATFSSVQFDTSLVGIGDKGVVECDSFKSDRIDIKIPDLTFEFSDDNAGTTRVHGIRDFQQRLAYWTYPYFAGYQQVTIDNSANIYPNRRLVYNYENDSWAIFTDSLTTLGTFQESASLSWANATFPWAQANFPWVTAPPQYPFIIGGNQQGFVEILGGNLNPKVSNDVSLTITAIAGNDTTPTVITSKDHNMVTGQIIGILNIPIGTPFSNLNGNPFYVRVIDQDTFSLWVYNSINDTFDIPQLDPSANVYVGGGQIALRDGFNIISKKFNALDSGQQLQIGYIDFLTNTTGSGAFTLNVYMNYNASDPVNVLDQNMSPSTGLPDPFFNSIVPTDSASSSQTIEGDKNLYRVICPVRGQFITLQYTLSNQQLVGIEQFSDVQIDMCILWQRPAGRLI